MLRSFGWPLAIAQTWPQLSVFRSLQFRIWLRGETCNILHWPGVCRDGAVEFLQFSLTSLTDWLMDRALARDLSWHPFQAELSCGRSVRPLPGEDAEGALAPVSIKGHLFRTGSSSILQVLARAECPGTGVACRLPCASSRRVMLKISDPETHEYELHHLSAPAFVSVTGLPVLSLNTTLNSPTQAMASVQAGPFSALQHLLHRVCLGGHWGHHMLDFGSVWSRFPGLLLPITRVRLRGSLPMAVCRARCCQG